MAIDQIVSLWKHQLSRSFWRTIDHSQWGPLFTICQFKPPLHFSSLLNTKLAAQPYTYPKFMVPWISFDYFWILQYEPNHHPPKPQFFQLKFSKLQLNRSQKITMKENKQIDLSWDDFPHKTRTALLTSFKPNGILPQGLFWSHH